MLKIPVKNTFYTWAYIFIRKSLLHVSLRVHRKRLIHVSLHVNRKCLMPASLYIN
jgi:hypothetical protein